MIAPIVTGSDRRRHTRTFVAMRSGQSGSKKIVVTPIINHGNTPIGNSNHVATWNATTATQATSRVRRHSSSATTLQSNAAPAQLSA